MTIRRLPKTKWPALLFALLLAGVLLLSACGGDDEESSAAETSSEASSDASGDASSDASGSGSLSEAPSAPPAPAATLQNDVQYACLSEERYPADRAPYLIFTDSAYTFHFNTGEVVIGNITGSYTLSGNALTLLVEECDCTDFRGENLAELRFTVQDEYRLVYSGDSIGLTHEGDIFEIEGAPPAAAPQPQSEAPASSPASSPVSGGESASAPDEK